MEALHAELPVLSVRAEQPDNLFRLADAAIVQFEFQMQRNPDDLERVYRTQFAVAEHYRCRVHTVVLYEPDVLEAPDTLDRGSAVFRVRNAHTGAMDGQAVVAMLRERIATGVPLSEAEAARIKLLPLMRQQRELGGVLREVAVLARGLPVPSGRRSWARWWGWRTVLRPPGEAAYAGTPRLWYRADRLGDHAAGEGRSMWPIAMQRVARRRCDQ